MNDLERNEGIQLRNYPCISTYLDFNRKNDKEVYLFHKKTKKSYVIGMEEYFLLLQADGTKSHEELAKKSNRYTKEKIEQLFLKFEELRFVNDTIELNDTERRWFRKKIGLINGNKLILDNALWNKVIAFLLKYLALPLFIFSIFAIALNNKFDAEYMQELQELRSALVMLPMIWISISLHEFGHASVARSYKVNVPEIGIMLYIIMPYAYTNLSFIATLKKKSQRLCILFSGILMNFLLSGISFLAALFVPFGISGYFILYGVANITLIITNMLIFFKLDGYFIFQEIIEEDSLREKSMQYVKTIFKDMIEKVWNKRSHVLQYERSGRDLADNIFYFVFGSLFVSYVPIIIVSWIINMIFYFA